jgi:hypothetical protein
MTTTQSSPKAGGPEKPVFNLKALAHQMKLVAALEAETTKSEPDADYLGQAKLTGLGLFRLVVVGEIKKGKSSFINALLGTKNLVPVHSDVSTSTIFKIHYGPEQKYTVYFEKDSGKEKLEIHAAQLADYGTEDGNPENEKQVDYIRVESPAPLLRNGLILVDTPGVGGLFKKHREITFRHVPNADAVFFVTDSIEAPIGADEVRFLKELRQVTDLITFVQTKSSKADSEARKARMANNLSIIEEQVGMPKSEISYFIVDSGLKSDADDSHDRDDLEDSGFMPLMAYLNNTLRKNREKHVAKSALSKTGGKLIAIAAALDSMKQVLDADTEEKRAELEKELLALQARLVEWEKEAKPRILEELRKGLSRVSRQAQEDLNPLRPGGTIQVEFESEIDKATTVEEVQNLMRQVEADLAALTSTACLKIAERAKSSATELLSKLQQDMVQSLTDCQTLELSEAASPDLDVNTSAISRVIARDTSDGVFDELRTGAYGLMAGGTIAAVGGAIIGSVIPVVGTAIGGIIGSYLGVTIAGIWGGAAALRIAESKKLDALKRESYMALQQGLASAHQTAATLINNLVGDIQMEATSFVQKAVSKTNDDLVKRRDELSANQKATQQEIMQKRRKHALLTKQFETIQTSLADFRKSMR